MPPIAGDSRDLKEQIRELIHQNKIIVFSKTTCPYCAKVKELFHSLNVNVFVLELDTVDKGPELQQALFEMFGQKTVPNVFISGQHIGGCDATMKLHSENRLLPMIEGETYQPAYDYDLIVIGGGSGGLAAAKEAARFGVKVACLDFVQPSPKGTTWGLGGTCVNVGCIPKKLMHQAAQIGHILQDARDYGWKVGDSIQHDWVTMKNSIQDHIGSLNFSARRDLKAAGVDYLNMYAKFEDPHHITCTDKRGQEKKLSAKYFILATGGRPKYPSQVEGCSAYCISSDDLFSLPKSPNKTLVVGASYVSLECAGFLHSLGLDVTVMVRSILLRGFDQQMAEMIGSYMQNEGIKFLRPCVPNKIEKLIDATDTEPALYRVTSTRLDTKEEVVGEYNTVMMAVGRDPCTSNIQLDKAGVRLNPSNGKVIVGDDESTSTSSIFAIGDIIEGRSELGPDMRPELTPVAIQAGRLLAQRLFGGKTLKCDYVNVPTTVFTPLEYGAVGMSEEAAIKKYGEDDLEVYHSNFMPLEWTVAHRTNETPCYAKLICVKSLNERVVGLHVLGPNAGEITQGWTVGIKLHATKADFDNAIGIHPTCAEVFTTLTVSKRSKIELTQGSC